MGQFFTFLIYSFLFLCVGGAISTYYLDVSPFACFSLSTKEIFINPFSDWGTLYHKFQYGSWAVDSLKNLMIFLVFLFFFPVWIGLWFLVKRIPFKKHLLKPFYFIKAHIKTKGNRAGSADNNAANVVVRKTSERPAAMRVTAGFGRYTPTTDTKDESDNNKNNLSSNTAVKNEAPAIVSINAPQKEQLRALGEKHGYELFEKVQLNMLVPFVFATDTVALVATFLTEDREWIADETSSQDGDEPTWFSAEGLIPSPFNQMVKASAFLKEKEPNSEIIPVVVVASGTILNAATMKNQWEEKGGFVVLWRDGKGEELDSLETLLQRKNETISEPLAEQASDLAEEIPLEMLPEESELGIVSEQEETADLPAEEKVDASQE